MAPLNIVLLVFVISQAKATILRKPSSSFVVRKNIVYTDMINIQKLLHYTFELTFLISNEVGRMYIYDLAIIQLTDTGLPKYADNLIKNYISKESKFHQRCGLLRPLPWRKQQRRVNRFSPFQTRLLLSAFDGSFCQ